jgi:ABC-type transport system involved in multi-copper enzyme maturation permease subunit
MSISSVALISLGSLLLAFCAWWRWWQPSYHLVGPHFFCDLVCLARRGRSTLLRCSYALMLLLGWCVVFMGRFPQVDLLSEPFAGGLRLPPDELSRFAGKFVQAIVIIQGLALLVLTPAYLAGAVADEKQANTLELLFTTDLRNREIVLGKLLGRLLHVAGVLLAGLPVLSLTMLWGGIDLPQLLAVFAVTCLSLLSAGSISILCSVLARRAVTAVVSSYVILFLMMTCCWLLPVSQSMSPITFLFQFERRLAAGSAMVVGTKAGPGALIAGSADDLGVLAQMVFESTVGHGLVTAVCLGLAIVLLRDLGLPRDSDILRAHFPRNVERDGVKRVRALPSQTGWGPGVSEPAVPKRSEVVPRQRRVPSQRARPAQSRRDPGIRKRQTYEVLSHFSQRQAGPRPAIGDNPLLWKELYQGKVYDPATFEWWIFCISMITVGTTCLMVLPHLLLNTHGDGYLMVASAWLTPIVRVFVIAIALSWCVPTALRATHSLSRERESKTLESLLVLPVDRKEILGAKWLGSILRYRALGLLLLTVLALALVTGALHPWAVLLLTFSCLGYLALLASAGLWVSLSARNSLWANFTMALLLLTFFLLPWIAFSFVRVLSDGREEAPAIIELGLNPLRSLWFCSFSWSELVKGIEQDPALLFANLGCCLLGIFIDILLACFFWLLAARQFRKLTT